MTLRVAAEQMTSIESVRASDQCGCVTLDNPSDAALGLLIDQASDVIAITSGMKVSGRRTMIARPCRKNWDGCGCSCCGRDGIPLGDQSVVIDSVKINGVALNSSTYELHHTFIGVNLVKRSTDIFPPSSWPSSQSLWKPDTEDDTFAIEFTSGVYVDQHIIEAAAIELVCDYVAEDEQRSSQLAPGITSASLGGANVTIEPNRLDRVANGQGGPAFTRLIGILAPAGRQVVTVWAPELMEGWDLNLRPG